MLRLATRRSRLGLYDATPKIWAHTDMVRWAGGGAGTKGKQGVVVDGKGGVGNLKAGEAKDGKTVSKSSDAGPGTSKPAPTPLELDTSSPEPSPSPPKSDPLSKSNLTTPTELERTKQSLAVWKDATLNLVRARAQKASEDAAVQLNELGGKLNKVTGYDAIEELKRKVVERGEPLP